MSGNGPSNRTQVEDTGAGGFVTIPAIGTTQLAQATRGIVILTAGNLSVVLDDGTDSNTLGCIMAVTPSPTPLPYRVKAFATGNTCTAIGVR